MEYKLIRSNRKTISLEISRNLQMIVRAPKMMPLKNIESFVLNHENWIQRHIKKIEEKNKDTRQRDPEQLKKDLREVIPQKVDFYAALMQLSPTSIKFNGAQKRFGSCNRNNGLNFSYILMEYPEKAIDYVVVHEIAHIKYKNHGKDFYALVEKYIPDYKERIKLLKN